MPSNIMRNPGKGVTDIFDGDSALHALELSKRIPTLGENFSKKISDLVKHFKIESSFDAEKIWPICFGKFMTGSNVEIVKDLLDLTNHESPAKIIPMSYSPYAPSKSFDEYFSTSIQEKTKSLIFDGIINGHTVIISRVLETNVENFFSVILEAVPIALKLNKTPKIIIKLSPVTSHLKTGKHESEKITTKLSDNDADIEIIAPTNRGIGSTAAITQLRHLWIWTGTITAILEMMKKYPNIVFFEYGPEIPTARDTFVLDNDAILDCFFVSLHEYDVGLDSTGRSVRHEAIDKFAYELLNETKNNSSPVFDNDQLLKIYHEALQEEKKILSLDSRIKEQLGYSMINDWEQLSQNIITGTSSTEQILEQISKKQLNIENMFANMRKHVSE